MAGFEFNPANSYILCSLPAQMRGQACV